MENYLQINKNTNVVENVCYWDGNPSTWTPPADALMLVQSTIPAMVWQWSSVQNDYVLVEQMGQGQIGFTWDGTVCTTNEPKPVDPPPSGLQEL